MLSQTDISPAIMLGSSPYPANKFGCVVTNVAQALEDAGYPVGLDSFVEALNGIGGFNAGGELIWNKVTELYPGFRFHADGSGAYKFISGSWNGHGHWLLEDSKGTFNPWGGIREFPKNFESGNPCNRSADIDPAPEAPAAPAEEPAPALPADPTVPEHTVVAGETLGQIVQDHYGHNVELWGPIGKVAFIASVNGISNPDLISVGQVIKLP